MTLTTLLHIIHRLLDPAAPHPGPQPWMRHMPARTWPRHLAARSLGSRLGRVSEARLCKQLVQNPEVQMMARLLAGPGRAAGLYCAGVLGLHHDVLLT